MNLLLYMQYIHAALQKPSPFVKFFNILFSFAFFFHRIKASISNKTGPPRPVLFSPLFYSTVTLLAKFLGLSTSSPLATDT